MEDLKENGSTIHVVLEAHCVSGGRVRLVEMNQVSFGDAQHLWATGRAEVLYVDAIPRIFKFWPRHTTPRRRRSLLAVEADSMVL